MITETPGEESNIIYYDENEENEENPVNISGHTEKASDAGLDFALSKSSSEDENSISTIKKKNTSMNLSISASCSGSMVTKKGKKEKTKYNNDIMHILKYAEDNNPHSLVLEVCQTLKWEHPKVQSWEILENNINVYKTSVTLKKFYGEGVGITKKISRSNNYIFY